MTGPRRRERRARRSLDDSLSKAQRDYLTREFDVGQRLGAARWHLRLAPYPLDLDTAEAVRGIIDNQVVPWGVFQTYVEEWAYPAFLDGAVAADARFRGRSRKEALAAVPDLETLRGV